MLHGQGHLVPVHVLLVSDLLPLVHSDDALVPLFSCLDHLTLQTLLLSVLVKKLPAERVHLKTTRQSAKMAPIV